ncbi:LytR/AlgR family response regulator transcription factor [Xanthobacteraceae bacterium A53D]
MLRVMLVDDEPPARRGLRRLLAAHADLEVVAEAGSLAEASAGVATARPDIVFLDVELGDGKGYEMLARVPEPPDVVFVTAYSRYAVNAFDVAASDFLLKPVDPERLALTLQRLRQRRADRAAATPAPQVPQTPPPVERSRPYLHLQGTRLMVPFDSVLSLHAEGDFTRVTTTDGRERMVCRLLGQFEEDLPDPPFCRLSRSIIINLDHLQQVAAIGGGRAQIMLGRQGLSLELGRAAARRLKEIGTGPVSRA